MLFGEIIGVTCEWVSVCVFLGYDIKYIILPRKMIPYLKSTAARASAAQPGWESWLHFRSFYKHGVMTGVMFRTEGPTTVLILLDSVGVTMGYMWLYYVSQVSPPLNPCLGSQHTPPAISTQPLPVAGWIAKAQMPTGCGCSMYTVEPPLSNTWLSLRWSWKKLPDPTVSTERLLWDLLLAGGKDLAFLSP